MPVDKFSMDNAVIMSNSSRWPLFIDPQLQANKWLKSSNQNCKLIRPTSTEPERDMKDLEMCINFGKVMIIEDLQEEIDPTLEPLLNKALLKKGMQ